MMHGVEGCISFIAALHRKNGDKFTLILRAGKAERLEMTAAVLINDISYGKMHQIAVLMEPLAAHLIQIKQPQNT
ncbi:hypothetical protein D3C81_1571070 [compost metagenome]